jgi:Ferritin-like
MIDAERGIITLDDLRDHLQYAIGLELTTIPAYLCALYTITPGASSAACEVIQSVVLEEMLHMSLAANVLNAIGGAPATGPVGGGPSPVPVYPATVPFIGALPVIRLQAFSKAAVDDFIAIERPAEQVEADADMPAADGRYGSIGAFYAAIEAGLRALGTPEVFRRGRATRAGCQLTAENYYGGAGTLIEVTDLDSALAALAEIVREGEGVSRRVLRQTAHEHLLSGARTPGRLGAPYDVDDMDRLPFGWKMYSHYARFSEIRAGRYYQPDQLVAEEPAGDVLPVDWRAVRPMTPDPAAQAYRGTWAYQPMMAFSAAYTALVDTVYRGFNGDPALLGQAVPAMYELKYQASSLLNVPSPLDESQTLGPAFEYLTLPRRTAAHLVYPQRRGAEAGDATVRH